MRGLIFLEEKPNKDGVYTKRGTMKFSTTLILFSTIAAMSSVATAADWCGEYTGRGKDYTKPSDRGHIQSVEKVHFTSNVQQLLGGAAGYIINDLEFMLNVAPNHYLALDSLTRLALREKTTRPDRAEVDLECRFQWAAEVNPRDAMIPVIRGNYYYRAGMEDEARKEFQKAAKLGSENPEANYNLGLALYKLKEYESARVHARKAYAAGYPLPGLARLLKEAGYPVK